MATLASGNLDNYGYQPSYAMSIPFITVFAVSGVIHSIQPFIGKRRLPSMLVMAVGCLCEVIGWAGRIWSRKNEFGEGFMMQICCLTMAPTFYSAALYLLLGKIIALIAPQNSPLSTNTFKIVFIVADVISLVIQAVGGALAATSETIEALDQGSNIMLGGIVFQLVVMLVYSIYGVVWTSRSRAKLELLPPNDLKNMKLLGIGMALSSLLIIMRGGYRTAELSRGFTGPLAHDQALFLLDAIPISIATLVLNLFHPSHLLPATDFIKNISPKGDSDFDNSNDIENLADIKEENLEDGIELSLPRTSGLDSLREEIGTIGRKTTDHPL